MIDEIYLSHTSSTQGAIKLDRDSADYLLDDEGLDWGELKAQITTTSSTYEQGSSVIGVEYAAREISIIGWIVGTQAQIDTKKAQLSRFITISNKLNIIVVQDQKTYVLEAWISDALKFNSSWRYNNEVMCQFSLKLYAPYPYFKLSKQVTFSDQSYSVYNLGELPTGAYMSFQLTANATDPTIHIGNDTMYLVGDFNSGDVISINTEHGHKSVYLNGSSNFSILRADSDWISIPITSESSPATFTLSFVANTTLEYNEIYSQLKGM